MKKFNSPILIFAGLMMMFFFSTVRAQEDFSDNAAQKQNLNQQKRPSLLAELNLSPDQVQQIRRINRENQPLLREAQTRLREAKSALDQAIYADNSDETEVRAKLKSVHAAQAEVVKLRSTTEFAVRKVLTPEQLVKFRELRQRFTERTENLPKQQQRRERQLNAPGRGLLNRQQRRLRNGN